MPPKKSSNRKTRRIASVQAPRELSPNTLVCPPAHFYAAIKHAKTQQDCYTILCVFDGLATTTGGGALVNVFTNNPSGFSNWSNIASVFDEYRVLGFQLSFEPYNFNGSIVVTAPIAVVNDYDSASALTGYTLAGQFSSYEEYPGGRKWTKSVLMSGAENASFLSTSATAATFYMKVYSVGNTASIDIGRFSIKSIIQFRGKGI